MNIKDIKYDNKEERRELVKKFIATGYNKKEIADILDVSTRTVNTDVKSVKNEIVDNLKNDDMKEIIFETLETFRFLKKKFLEIEEKKENGNTKVASLKGVRKVMKDKIEFLQNIGLLHKEPEKIAKAETKLDYDDFIDNLNNDKIIKQNLEEKEEEEEEKEEEEIIVEE